MKQMRWMAAVLALFMAVTLSAGAELRLPKIISAHGVLQRERPIHIWGWAEPAACVQVKFDRQTRQGCADRLGMWSVYLDPEQAGGPYTLTVEQTASSAAPLTVDDLLVGDVWFASGQSNMQLPLQGFNADTPVKDGAKEIAAATHPHIRLLRMEQTASAYPTNDIPSTWTECTPQTAASFSAVAYFFGREINQHEKVPIGLIDSTWGGTPIESWISLETIGHDPALMPLFASRARFSQRFADRVSALAAEQREIAAAKQAGKPEPHFPWHPDNEGSWNPAYLFNGMVSPFTPYTLRGFLWYQGETNSDPERAPLYAREMRALIADWRSAWREGNLPFLYAQISSFRSPAEDWGAVRDAQRRALDVRNTAMAVTLDVGTPNNVHPPDKQTVGHRLALGALAESYGEAVQWSGPLPDASYREGHTVHVWFQHADGLHATARDVRGFTLAGQDGLFQPATAHIVGRSVVIESAKVPEPAAVRYGWASDTDADLTNGDGLPASTFEQSLGQP